MMSNFKTSYWFVYRLIRDDLLRRKILCENQWFFFSVSLSEAILYSTMFLAKICKNKCLGWISLGSPSERELLRSFREISLCIYEHDIQPKIQSFSTKSEIPNTEITIVPREHELFGYLYRYQDLRNTKVISWSLLEGFKGNGADTEGPIVCSISRWGRFFVGLFAPEFEIRGPARLPFDFREEDLRVSTPIYQIWQKIEIQRLIDQNALPIRFLGFQSDFEIYGPRTIVECIDRSILGLPGQPWGHLSSLSHCWDDWDLNKIYCDYFDSMNSRNLAFWMLPDRIELGLS